MLKRTMLGLFVATLFTGGARAMTLVSSDIQPGAAIGPAYLYPRCGGRNVSPQLTWSGAPSTARSLALTMIDLDVKPAGWSHWIVVGLPTDTRSLSAGAHALPAGARTLMTDFGDAAYGGPCPPAGSGIHHYRFTIWALPTPSLSIAAGATANDIVAKLSRLALDHASFTATAER
jgi:Raf kinase inhibitor-like YbhB/YbcL family protein